MVNQDIGVKQCDAIGGRVKLALSLFLLRRITAYEVIRCLVSTERYRGGW